MYLISSVLSIKTLAKQNRNIKTQIYDKASEIKTKILMLGCPLNFMIE